MIDKLPPKITFRGEPCYIVHCTHEHYSAKHDGFGIPLSVLNLMDVTKKIIFQYVKERFVEYYVLPLTSVIYSRKIEKTEEDVIHFVSLWEMQFLGRKEKKGEGT